jgi:hypothetical protein
MWPHPKNLAGAENMDMRPREHDGGEFPVDISLSAIQTGDTLLLTAFVRDITERLAADDLQGSLAERPRAARAPRPVRRARAPTDRRQHPRRATSVSPRCASEHAWPAAGSTSIARHQVGP